MSRAKSRLRRMEAWIAGRVLEPRQASSVIVFCIALFAALNLAIVSGLKRGQSLFMDSTEAYAWGQQFLGGYGRHPPLTGWIAGLWYRVFPASDLSSYALTSLVGAVALVAIYFIARRVFDPRRAALIVFVLMCYPLLVGAKAGRFNNYHVLLAVIPVLVLSFLLAYERRTVLSGAVLGLAAAAAALTIYSGLVAVLAIGLAALLHPQRARFLASPAPYVAALVFIVALLPHLIWLVQGDYTSLRWAESQIEVGSQVGRAFGYLGHQAALIGIPLAVAAIALWPWRACRAAAANSPLVPAPKGGTPVFAGHGAGTQGHTAELSSKRPLDSQHSPRRRAFALTRGNERLEGRFLIVVIAATLVCVPVLAGILLNVRLKSDWGNSLFSLVPIAMLALAPSLLVTRRAVARAAMIAGAGLVALLVGAAIYPRVHFKMMPGDEPYRPLAEMAREVTKLWRERFHSPLPIVVSLDFSLAAPVVFYSPDHPRMFADVDPAYSPWIDYPTELQRRGFVGICIADQPHCTAYLDGFAPQAERVNLTLVRNFAGITSRELKVIVWIMRPAA
jgi:4-amino-4-deoxy-L-arabinose transferase-like glycosyltransferase